MSSDFCATLYILRSYYILQISSRHVSSCDVYACSWDVRGDLTLNSMVQIHTYVTLLVISRGALVGSRASTPLKFLLSHTFRET
jgi:hypothetical protein